MLVVTRILFTVFARHLAMPQCIWKFTRPFSPLLSTEVARRPQLHMTVCSRFHSSEWLHTESLVRRMTRPSLLLSHSTKTRTPQSKPCASHQRQRPGQSQSHCHRSRGMSKTKANAETRMRDKEHKDRETGQFVLFRPLSWYGVSRARTSLGYYRSYGCSMFVRRDHSAVVPP